MNGGAFELVTGGVGVVAAGVGIAGYEPVTMGAVATIALGLSLLVQGSTLALGSQRATHVEGSEQKEAVGIGSEVLAGLAAFVIGVVVLLGIVPLVLLPVAAIVAGTALLLGGPAQPQMAEAEPRSSMRHRVVRESMRTTSSVMVTAGLAGVVLGVLGLALDGYVVLLALIGLLAIAASLVVTGGTVAARFARA